MREIKIGINAEDFPDGNSNILDLERVPKDCKIEDLKIDYEGLTRIENYLTQKINREVAKRDEYTAREKLKVLDELFSLIRMTYITAGYRVLSEKMDAEDSFEFISAYGGILEKEKMKMVKVAARAEINIPFPAMLLSGITSIFQMVYYKIRLMF